MVRSEQGRPQMGGRRAGQAVGRNGGKHAVFGVEPLDDPLGDHAEIAERIQAGRFGEQRLCGFTAIGFQGFNRAGQPQAEDDIQVLIVGPLGVANGENAGRQGFQGGFFPHFPNDRFVGGFVFLHKPAREGPASFARFMSALNDQSASFMDQQPADANGKAAEHDVAAGAAGFSKSTAFFAELQFASASGAVAFIGIGRLMGRQGAEGKSHCFILGNASDRFNKEIGATITTMYS